MFNWWQVNYFIYTYIDFFLNQNAAHEINAHTKK